jgi:hypothetical protein
MDSPSHASLNFLSLPVELRLKIYRFLLVIARPSPGPESQALSVDRPHPAILRACKQIHGEATPVLYGENIFFAHYAMLTSFPLLRGWFQPVKCTEPAKRIRRWWLRVRLDAGLPFAITTRGNSSTQTKLAEAFSGAEELVLELWQAMFKGMPASTVLQYFEAVRGVRKVRIFGSIIGYEDYVAWLEKTMQSPIGEVREPYTPSSDADDPSHWE